MKPLSFRLFGLLALAAAMISAGNRANADSLADADAQKVQAIVVQQFKAFAQDDADSAFETATPAVRESFGSPGMFLAVVRGMYPMIYNASSVTFHKPQEDASDGTVLQLVQIQDPEAGPDGKSWLALFALERQPDSTWRISNCVVTENHWQNV